MKILHVVGARPNFMKAASVMIDTLVRLQEAATDINDPQIAQITQITQSEANKNGFGQLK